MASKLPQRFEVKDVALRKLITTADPVIKTLCDFKAWYEAEGLTSKSTDTYGKLVKQYNDEVHNELSCCLANFSNLETEAIKDARHASRISKLRQGLGPLLSKVPDQYSRVKIVTKFGTTASDLRSALGAMTKYPDVMAVFFLQSDGKADRASTGNRQTSAKSGRPVSAQSGSKAHKKRPPSGKQSAGGANSRPEFVNKDKISFQCQDCVNLMKELAKQRLRTTHLEKNVEVLTKKNKEKASAIKNVEAWANTLCNENKVLKTQLKTLEADNVRLQECLDKVKSPKEQKSLMDTLSSDKLLKTREKHMKEMDENFERELEYRDQRIQEMRDEIASLTDRLSAEMSKKVSSDESAIENINIKHRPMTIAEDYYNFCSNAWLDAKMMLDEKCPKEIERVILEFLNSVLEIASARTVTALADLFKFLDLQILHPGVLVQAEKLKAKSGTLPVEISLLLGDYMRVTSGKADMSTLASDVKKTLEQQKSKFVKLLQDEAMSAYIQEACVIGWQMAIQRPPMEFRWDGVGKTWQEVLQEPYWRCDPYKEGATVKYYVHPSMHHGGAVLVKGKVYID